MVIFSGIQPTGRKHLGNYIGAIAQYVAARTAATRRSTASSTCTPPRSTTTPRSCASASTTPRRSCSPPGWIPSAASSSARATCAEHTELCWLLSRVTAIGELNRMHQFRDKSVAQRQLVSAGLLFYPVLQAADVLAYRAHEVPVGEDQREHLELMRDVARALQRALRRDARGARAPHPDGRARGSRDLQEPERKMSTTGGTEQGTVYVLDEPDAIRKKFRRAVTDSGTEIVPRRRTSPASRT